MLRLWKCTHYEGIWAKPFGSGSLASTLLQLGERERDNSAPTKSGLPQPPQWGPDVASRSIPHTYCVYPEMLPAIESWGAVHILVVKPERPSSPPHPFYLHPSNYATPPDPAFYPFYPGLSACSPKQAGLSRWRLL